MKFTSTDAWLLQAVFRTEGQNGAKLKDVIGYADMTNHAIITYKEFSESLTRMASVSVMRYEDGILKTSDELKSWHEKKTKGKTSFVILKEMNDFQKYLNTTFEGTDSPQTPAMAITEEQFRAAVDQYLNVANGLADKIVSKNKPHG